MSSMTMSAGAVTVTNPDNTDRFSRPVVKWQFDWTCDASGNVTGTLNDMPNGQLVMMLTVPSASAAPTDNYDIAINVLGADILGGAGQNRDTANAEIAYPTATVGAVTYPVQPAVYDKLSFAITNAGNATSGTIYLYFR